MTSPLRTLAYRHRWLYDSVTAISAVAVGGVERLRDLGADWLAEAIGAGASVLDLCCGGGDAAIALASRGFAVTGLDVAPRALEQAARRAPQLSWIEGLAEDPPFSAGTFDAVQISLALHEFTPEERRAVLVRADYRVQLFLLEYNSSLQMFRMRLILLEVLPLFFWELGVMAAALLLRGVLVALLLELLELL